MKTKTIKFLTITTLALAALALPLQAAELSSTDKEFLSNYEKLHVALAADDLPGAKKAATEMGEKGKAIASAEKIETARAEFGKMSEDAIEMAKGQDGYYVAHCPMLKKSWVQTSTAITNPYAGSSMLTCGVIKK